MLQQLPRNKKKAAILRVVMESEIELTPKQIHDKLKREMSISRSTVRIYLRELLEEGYVVQPYHRSYCNTITHGMMIAPIRTHNICLSVNAPYLKDFEKIPDIEEWTGDVKIRIQFGKQRRRLIGKISCDAGMDLNTIQFAISRVYDLMEEKTNHEVENVIVKTFEVNRDYDGVRLDGGLKCYTKKSLFGALFRVYQKDPTKVRVEQKVSYPMPVDYFLNI